MSRAGPCSADVPDDCAALLSRPVAGRIARRTAMVMIAAVSTLALLQRSHAQVVPHAQIVQPPPGSALRSQVLAALRPTVQGEIGGAVEFAVSEIRVLADWAYVSVRPQRPGGRRIDWRATKFRQAWQADMMSELVLALLRQEPSGWRVVEYAIGPTDVAWETWIEPHRLQRRLFLEE